MPDCWSDWELALVREFRDNTVLLQRLLFPKPTCEIISTSLIVDHLDEEDDLDVFILKTSPSPDPEVMDYFTWQKVKREREKEAERKRQLAMTPRHEVIHGKYTCAFCYGSPDGCAECDHGFLYDPIYDRRTGNLRVWSK